MTASSQAEETALRQLESEAVEIIREVAVTAERAVMLYSIGKDSSVLLHLARKAFAPNALPFPLLHIDTGWKFAEMIAFRDAVAADTGVELIVHRSGNGPSGARDPFTGGSAYTQVMKTEALREALTAGGYTAAFGGARRDEEKSRAKERIVSVRAAGHTWDPKAQRPELWNIYNTELSAGQTLRAFPLSNWTERDVWAYIRRENIAIVPLYFAKERPVVERGGQLIMADDDRLPLNPGETPTMRRVRFRTLGCYPLTAAMVSDADTLDAMIEELDRADLSERAGRLIDAEAGASMEAKKREGYF